MKGTWKRFLEVNLTTGSAVAKELPESVFLKYLGGLGLASRLLLDYTEPNIDPLSEKNVVVIAPGLLVGTGLPTASKTTLTFKSPLTNAFGRSVSGAYLGVALRKAGYDAMVIIGKSSKPVYLLIEDDKFIVKDASHLWGRDAIETQEILRKDLGSEFRTAAIGTAGEKLLLIADIDFEERQSARAGGGAVMGSKMLKAIAVKGTKTPGYADLEALKKAILEWNKKINASEAKKLDMGYGSGEFYEWINKERGVFPVKNWQESYFEESFDKHKDGKSPLDPYYWSPKYTEKLHPCPNCTKPCGRFISIKEGKYAGDVHSVYTSASDINR